LEECEEEEFWDYKHADKGSLWLLWHPVKPFKGHPFHTVNIPKRAIQHYSVITIEIKANQNIK